LTNTLAWKYESPLDAPVARWSEKNYQLFQVSAGAFNNLAAQRLRRQPGQLDVRFHRIRRWCMCRRQPEISFQSLLRLSVPMLMM